MLRILKINTAILLVIVFVFKSVILDINVISSVNKDASGDLDEVEFYESGSECFSHDEKKTDWSLLEICEKDADDDDDEIKFSSVLFANVLFSFLEQLHGSKESNTHYDNYSSFTYSYRYLQLQVFRI